MCSIYANVKKDADYRASCGLGLKEFNELYQVFEEVYETKKELPHGEQKQPILTDKREALFFILYYLKTGVTFHVLGIAFGISNASAKTYVERIKPYLKIALDTMGYIPKNFFTNQEDFKKKIAKKEDLFIDCTEIPIARADEYEKQKEFYSGKKKTHTVKFLIICDSRKKILYISKIHEGKKHDFKILEEELENIDIFEHAIWVDLGFLGIAKKAKNEEDLKKINIPHKASKNKPLTEIQKEENKQKSSKRAVVENSIASLKTFYILKNRHRTLDLNNIETTVRICSGLANLKNKSYCSQFKIPNSNKNAA